MVGGLQGWLNGISHLEFGCHTVRYSFLMSVEFAFVRNMAWWVVYRVG